MALTESHFVWYVFVIPFCLVDLMLYCYWYTLSICLNQCFSSDVNNFILLSIHIFI